MPPASDAPQPDPARPTGPRADAAAPPPRGAPVRIDAHGPLGDAALSVLMSGRADGPEPPVHAFRDHAATHQMDLSGLWAVCGRRGRPRQTALAVPGVGRTAMLFLSPTTRRAQVGPAAELTRAAIARPPVCGLPVVQALLSPEETLKAQALEHGGMTRLAELMYLHRPAGDNIIERPDLADPAAPAGLIRPRPKPADPDDPESLSGEAWTPDHDADFAQLIEASYEHTRDCPGLRGLRDIKDVIDGHRATGVFHPGLWTLWSDRRGPVAALLMAEAAPSGAQPAGSPPGAELVYLGVAPRGRGRGLGAALLRYGIAAAAPFGGAVSLAVDRDNPAARRLYRRAGFAPTAHRVAWIAVPPQAE